MLTDEEVNQFIHEKIEGKCWHEVNTKLLDGEQHSRCHKCSYHIMPDYESVNPSYTSSWSDYGPMLERLSKHDRWDDFLFWIVEWSEFVERAAAIDALISPSKGCAAIFEFFKEEGK